MRKLLLGIAVVAMLGYVALLGWTVLFGVLAVWAYRRDEGRRFG